MATESTFLEGIIKSTGYAPSRAIPLPAWYGGFEVYTLQGDKLWECRVPEPHASRTIEWPATVPNTGIHCVRYLK